MSAIRLFEKAIEGGRVICRLGLNTYTRPAYETPTDSNVDFDEPNLVTISSRRSIYRSAIAPKKPSPSRAQRVQDRPRRRRRSGRSCATERSEGAPVLAQRPAALARSLQAMRGAARRAPVVDGSTYLLPPPLALALAPQASVGQLLRRRALRSAE